MTNILEIKNLCVEVDGQELLHSINLTIICGTTYPGTQSGGSRRFEK